MRISEKKIYSNLTFHFKQTLEIGIAIKALKIENKESYKNLFSTNGNKIINTCKENNQRFRGRSRFKDRVTTDRFTSRNKSLLNLTYLSL